MSCISPQLSASFQFQTNGREACDKQTGRQISRKMSISAVEMYLEIIYRIHIKVLVWHKSVDLGLQQRYAQKRLLYFRLHFAVTLTLDLLTLLLQLLVYNTVSRLWRFCVFTFYEEITADWVSITMFLKACLALNYAWFVLKPLNLVCNPVTLTVSQTCCRHCQERLHCWMKWRQHSVRVL